MEPTRFVLTTQHLTLLQHAYVEWEDAETGAPAIDPKRPYGNSDVGHHVAEILGLGWPDEDKLSDAEYDRQYAITNEAMLKIHRETAIALAIVCQHAGRAVEPGTYENRAGRFSRPKWVRVSD